MSRPARWAALLVAIAVLGGGCVFTGVNKLPDNWDGKSKPVCDTSKIPILFDSVWSAAYLANAVVVGVVLPKLNEQPTNPLSYVIGVVFAIAGIAHAASALQGTTYVRRCRAAKFM